MKISKRFKKFDSAIYTTEKFRRGAPMIDHAFYMQQAVLLSEQARFHAPPNPWVGCVIVKNGHVIGKGFTRPPGGSHAEIEALNDAGENARGASLFTTLEPCAHTGRTPPCTRSIIRAGIKEVFIGVEDPDPLVKGKGIQELLKAGISVRSGICREEIARSLRPYLYQRRYSLPYTVLKIAVSIDGRIACPDDTSQWITCPEAREDVHLQRARSQAIVIGANTALKDHPRLTVRHPLYSGKDRPLRVILDSGGRVPPEGPLFDRDLAPTLIVTTSRTNPARIREWEKKGAEVQTVSASARGVDLNETWNILGKKSILQTFVEGGASLHTSLLETSLCNRLSVYFGSLLIGSKGRPFFLKEIETLEDAKTLRLIAVKKIGNTVRVDYACSPNESEIRPDQEFSFS